MCFGIRAQGNHLAKRRQARRCTDKQTMHGFRHIASTALNEQGFNGDWVERQLAHKDPNQTRKTYNKAEYLEQRTAMMQAYADYLDSLKDGNK